MSDGIGLAEALLGLDGFRILDVAEVSDEVVITIETTSDRVGCTRCGVRAEAHDRVFRSPHTAGVGEATVALH